MILPVLIVLMPHFAIHLAIPVPNIERSNSIKISTYNLWNVMFNWEIRKFRIAQIIKEESPDLIAFQEVRGDIGRNNQDRDQISDLQTLLPQYQSSYYLPINRVVLKETVYRNGWESEGIGILSKHTIKEVSVQNLTYSYGPDTNRRAILHVKLYIQDFGFVNLAVVHFSYDRQQQCGNAVELLHFINEARIRNVVALGDFNTYKDFDLPISVLAQAKSVENTPCSAIKSKYMQKFAVTLADSWATVNPTKEGLTFSNMPIPGPESRPDRILLSDSLRPLSASLTGAGSVYKHKYFYHIIWKRGEDIFWATYDSFMGRAGRPCLHDCGPHASCRCGVCVSGGDRRTCDIPDCEECNSGTFILLLLIFVVFTLLTVQLIYGVLLVFLTMNEKAAARHETEALCGNICLCDPDLYVSMSKGIRRRTRQSILWRVWPLCRLPPMVLVLVTFGLTFVCTEFSLLLFQGLLDDVYAVIPEEFYPSDHLMLTVELTTAKSSIL